MPPSKLSKANANGNKKTRNTQPAAKASSSRKIKTANQQQHEVIELLEDSDDDDNNGANSAVRKDSDTARSSWRQQHV
jgi:hypothetical protein